ncbi:hypothetical protein [Microbulbifer halophilus]|uniref:Uncharacterized protein n=1 Tax=Microbulbifer halophilus TaxID=453963 RepID=A0ABW5EB88_9GAMM|nr:hypothetical protein [Microbulbifer halophilus]MCW8126710.1 hypothetical protein [Microbulbifer halophilus]
MRQLQLKHHDRTVGFLAGADNLRPRLHSAFITLSADSAGTKAILLVRHTLHGWLQVCDEEQRYPIISNPLLLNCDHLWRAVLHTLAEADSWPSDEEKRRRKLEREIKRRAEIAEARRRTFRLV